MSQIIRINNFRSFANLELPVRPLTFLFGPNGSGKSSFIKAMKFMNKNLFPLTMNHSANYCIDSHLDFGSFTELVRGNDKDRKIEIEIEFSTVRLETYFKADLGIPEKNREECGLDYMLEKETFTFKKQPAVDYGTLYKNTLNPKYILKIVIDNSNRISLNINNPSGGFTVKCESIEEVLNPVEKISWFQPQTKIFLPDNKLNQLFEKFSITPPFSGDPDYPKLLREFIYKNLQGKMEWDQYTPSEKERIYHYVLSILQDVYENIHLTLSHVFSSFHYGPTRELPKHEYLINSLGGESKKGFIFDYEDLLKLYVMQKANRKGISNIMSRLSRTLTELELAKKIEIIEGEGKLHFQVHSFDGSKYNLAEASSGLLQILPILVGTSSNVEEGYSYYIEQPELHLHPKLQASLIQILNDNRKAQLGSTTSPSFIIETHSEHMIRKIQVMIAKGEIDKNQVAVYYFDKNKKRGTTTLKEMILLDNGFFKESWPDGFFDDSYNLTKELLFAKNN